MGLLKTIQRTGPKMFTRFCELVHNEIYTRDGIVLWTPHEMPPFSWRFSRVLLLENNFPGQRGEDVA